MNLSHVQCWVTGINQQRSCQAHQAPQQFFFTQMFARTVSISKSGTTKRVRLYKIMDESTSFSLCTCLLCRMAKAPPCQEPPPPQICRPLPRFVRARSTQWTWGMARCYRRFGGSPVVRLVMVNSLRALVGMGTYEMINSWRLGGFFPRGWDERLFWIKWYKWIPSIYFHSRWVVLLEDAVDMDWCRCSQKALRLRGMNVVMTPFPPTGDSLNIKISQAFYKNKWNSLRHSRILESDK